MNRPQNSSAAFGFREPLHEGSIFDSDVGSSAHIKDGHSNDKAYITRQAGYWCISCGTVEVQPGGRNTNFVALHGGMSVTPDEGIYVRSGVNDCGACYPYEGMFTVPQIITGVFDLPFLQVTSLLLSSLPRHLLLR